MRRGVLLLAALTLTAAPAAAANFELCAKAGTLTLPGAVVVPIWGFAEGPCSAPSLPTVPGPVLRATNGEIVNITLGNSLPVAVSLLIPGQTVTAASGTPGNSFASEVAPGGTVVYSFVASTGTYIYESGSDTARQVAMGLHGALVVATGQINPVTLEPKAYSQNRTSFDVEAVLVLSEIDPVLNANPLAFNMQAYAPTYWLINGKSYPDTDPIVATSGQKVLIRYLNPSFNHHAMSLPGLHQQLIARDAFELATVILVLSETIPAGTTADAIAQIPNNSAGRRYPLVNRNLRLTNGSGNAPGGMRTHLQVQ